MARLFAVLVVVLHALPLIADDQPFSHALLDQVLRTYVDDHGLVDYAGLKKDRQTLDTYIDSLRATSPLSSPARFSTPQHALAYWINAYNAIVLRGVVDAYPIASVKDIKVLNGFFNRMDWTIGGQSLTLDHIENKIIRPLYKDPRIHFVVNCGAVSCPELENSAFIGTTLDDRLESAAQRFANNKKHLYIKGNTLYFSKILDWYGNDFSNWFPADRANPAARPALVNYFLPYLPTERAEHLKSNPIQIEFSAYNWALNEQQKP